MTYHLAGAAGALALLLGASAATAQTSAVIVAPPSGYVVVNPQQETLVQRYVITQPGTAVVPSGYAPMVGSTVPVDVQLNSFATGYDYGGFDATSYRYIVTPDRETVVVEPGTRRVIQVIR
ncbi:hypothetical protein ABLE91_08185 [Aquabacter sp. CN5-332]|uniref:hypothetical protein n=1 Tax=Aquabacter sp. CN5-332 TaxID=3156608 RepID=UPI0032B43248